MVKPDAPSTKMGRWCDRPITVMFTITFTAVVLNLFGKMNLLNFFWDYPFLILRLPQRVIYHRLRNFTGNLASVTRYMFPRLKLSSRASVGYGILFSFFWIYEIAQSLYCICHSCYQNVYLNGIRAWVIDEKAHSMFKHWIHITNYCVCKLNDIGNLHFNLRPELNLGFLTASSSRAEDGFKGYSKKNGHYIWLGSYEVPE